MLLTCAYINPKIHGSVKVKSMLKHDILCKNFKATKRIH